MVLIAILSEGMVQLFKKLNSLFSANPLASGVITAGCIIGAGDLTSQFLIEKRKKWDDTRTRAMVIFGCLYSGGFQTLLWVYGYGRFFAWLPLTAGNHTRQAVGKTLVDNFIHTPLIYLPTFYITQTLLRGGSMGEAAAKLEQEWFDTVLVAWKVWIPFQALNFYFTPPHLLVPANLCAAYLWNTALAFMANRREVRPDEQTQKKGASTEMVAAVQ
ncbi:unnamed protein product [Vitrella brassicaformis CCMP3155]|uniref:Peroxisomal membrane protein MPV17 n=3 Tax=Vitrella brassicaformis TaxID=1169539 RepID=A0A0G4FWT9_VITBC|nr:unnamed protein product [Vitrella brassicaformis CCMP3155]|eukprot:CEM19612.1 unnamed protein product [Vitrella brassicaformis CCMP3155]